jgi:hypothetical protein
VAENKHGKDEADVEITVLCKYNARIQKLSINHINWVGCSRPWCSVSVYRKCTKIKGIKAALFKWSSTSEIMVDLHDMVKD